MKPRSDDANAFIPDPDGGPAHTRDDLAEALGEDFLKSATGEEEADDEMFAGVVPEENGGPFVVTSARQEFAHDIDASNPPDAEQEPLPLTISASPHGTEAEIEEADDEE